MGKKKSTFTPAQTEKLAEVVRAYMRRTGMKQGGVAERLGISQTNVSKLLGGTYGPGLRVGHAIAELAGMKLENIVGAFEELVRRDGKKPNLEITLSYHRRWPAWVAAAARACPIPDLDPKAWEPVLDEIEVQLAPIWEKPR